MSKSPPVYVHMPEATARMRAAAASGAARKLGADATTRVPREKATQVVRTAQATAIPPRTVLTMAMASPT
jgi:hypothetical protein